MKKFTSLNENKFESYTWEELIFRVKNNECKLVGILLEELQKDLSDYFPAGDYDDVLGQSIGKGQWGESKITTNKFIVISEVFVVVFNDDYAPIALICEYEVVNPFWFGDIIVVPGHDSITCFNKVTLESKRAYIR